MAIKAGWHAAAGKSITCLVLLFTAGCAEQIAATDVLATRGSTSEVLQTSSAAKEAPQSQPALATQPAATAEPAAATQPGAATRPVTATQAVVTNEPTAATSAPASGDLSVIYDLTAPKAMPARDWFERRVRDRGADLRLVDALLDADTEPPPFRRVPPGTLPADDAIAEGVPTLADSNPFPEPVALRTKEPSIVVGAAKSTYRTRTAQETLSALAPLFDLIQREVDIRATAVLWQTPEEIYYGLLDGKQQMAISHVFDYLLVRDWFQNNPDNGTVLLSWAEPDNPYTGTLDAGFVGPPGTSVAVVVAADSKFQNFAELRGARLALATGYVNAPGTFLTTLLADIQQPPGEHFFSQVTLRRYAKDAVIDVFKGNADAACVDQGTIGTLVRFYGISPQIRELAVSPRYNVDVLYTSLNNVETHRTEIEMTQRQVTTLGKNPEGQTILFLFDTRQWHVYREGDLAAAREHFGDFLRFMDHTPIDLKPLLDPAAPVDRRTYDRYGDE